MSYVETITSEGLVRDHGLVGPLACPQCDGERIHVLEIRSNGILAWFNIGTRWVLRCAACDFDVDVPSGETMDAMVRTDLVRNYLAKEMSDEDFAKGLFATSFPTLSTMEDESAKWTCRQCNETVPDNFHSCWQCGTDKPGAVVESDDHENHTVQDVTAAIIIKDTRVLIARRADGKHAGEWEFPGGKVENGEIPEECLRRELNEEFQVDSEIGEFLMESVHDYGFGTIRLLAYYVTLRSYDLTPTDHDAVEWVEPNQLSDFALLPADVPIAKAIAQGQHVT